MPDDLTLKPISDFSPVAVLLIGGPAAGQLWPLAPHMREIAMYKFGRLPRFHDFEERAASKSFNFDIGRYRYEYVRVASDNFFGQFAAMVWEDITDPLVIRRLVVAHVLASLISKGATQ